MGNSASFENIEKKYGQEGTDYVISKYRERKIYATIEDQIKRLNDNVNHQEEDDLHYIKEWRLKLDQGLSDAISQAETHKKGSVAEAEAKSKQKVEQFSGYNEEKIKLDKLQKDVKDKYQSERTKMEEKVRDQVRKHEEGRTSKLTRIPEYDNHPDNYRKSIEDQCVKKYPQKATAPNASDLQKKLVWDNYKQNFTSILNRDQTKDHCEDGISRIKKNITPSGAPICC